MRQFSISDFALHDFGGSGPPVLMGHANGFHGMVWRQVAESLSPNYHCYAVDFRGHGDTPRVSSDTNYWEQSARELVEIASTLSDEPLLAVGHSMGGACIALGEELAPGTFRAGWLFEPILFPDTHTHEGGSESNPFAEGARRRREIFASRQEALERYASRPPLNSLDSRTLADYVNYGFLDLPDGSVRLKCRGEMEASVFQATTTGYLERVQHLAIPLKIARGSGPGPSELAPHVAQAMANAELETFTELSHFGPLEAPEMIAQSIHSFFSEVTTRA